MPGERIERGIGSFAMRGIAISIVDHPNHIPIGLVSDAVVARSVEQGQMLMTSDLHLPDTLALRLWKGILQRALAARKVRKAGSVANFAKPC